ncbi:hypothetical protein LPJ75_002550, partial [Coemansia sp. RSA 2598]
MSYRAAVRSGGNRNVRLGAFAVIPFSAINLLESEEVDVHAPPAKVVPSTVGKHVVALPVPPNAQVHDISTEINKLTFDGGFFVNINKAGGFATVCFTNAKAVETASSGDLTIMGNPAKPIRLIQYKKSIFRVKLQNTGIIPDPVVKAQLAHAAMKEYGEILEIELYREASIERHFADTISLIMDLGDRTELPGTVQIGEANARIISSCSPITCNYCKLTGHSPEASLSAQQ